MTAFLAKDDYVDISAPGIVRRARALFDGVDGETEKAEIAYTFVRDEIAHSFGGAVAGGTRVFRADRGAGDLADRRAAAAGGRRDGGMADRAGAAA